MAKSIVGIAQTNLRVERTIDELQEDALIPVSEISVLIPESGAEPELGAVKMRRAPEGASAGAITGGVLGGTLGLLAGIGTLTLPGLGPLIAAGPIMAVLGGTAARAAAGGVVGALVGLGIPENEAKLYEERLKAGGYLVAVRVQDNEIADICRDIMKRNNLDDVTLVSERYDHAVLWGGGFTADQFFEDRQTAEEWGGRVPVGAALPAPTFVFLTTLPMAK